MSRTAGTIGVVAGMGILAGSILLGVRAKTAPLGPSIDDILISRTLAELEIWYWTIGRLLFMQEINKDRYGELYHTYVKRFYELIGDHE